MEQQEVEITLKPMSSAPRDGTPVLARFRSDLGRDPRVHSVISHEQRRWSGKWNVIYYSGTSPDGYDFGWLINAPVGVCGFDDAEFDGWMMELEK